MKILIPFSTIVLYCTIQKHVSIPSGTTVLYKWSSKTTLSTTDTVDTK